MKIRFLKNHVNAKAGEEKEVEENLGKYLLRMSVVESVDQNPERTEEILMNHLTKESMGEVKTASDMNIATNFPGASQLYQDVPKTQKKIKPKN